MKKKKNYSYCPIVEKQVSKEACINCQYWDTCDFRPVGEGIATASVIAFAVIALLGLYFLIIA